MTVSENGKKDEGEEGSRKSKKRETKEIKGLTHAYVIAFRLESAPVCSTPVKHSENARENYFFDAVLLRLPRAYLT